MKILKVTNLLNKKKKTKLKCRNQIFYQKNFIHLNRKTNNIWIFRIFQTSKISI